jgi:serine O-acetyltransferase
LYPSLRSTYGNWTTRSHTRIRISCCTHSRNNESQRLRGALWDEQHYGGSNEQSQSPPENPRLAAAPVQGTTRNSPRNSRLATSDDNAPPYPTAFYPDIDLSSPDSVYTDDGQIDLVWDLLRWEAYQNQQEQYEPLLVSFLHSSVLNHASLESSLAFLLANRLQSPAMMISTQLQALLGSALGDCPVFRRKLRADIMAVRDRDPACHSLPDVFLYFKGFHALESHRAAHVLWNSGRTVLAQYLHSQVSQIFQIDIHPNATIGSGIMLDHGTGIVIGETVRNKEENGGVVFWQRFLYIS